jgi:hypothetical protein
MTQCQSRCHRDRISESPSARTQAHSVPRAASGDSLGAGDSEVVGTARIRKGGARGTRPCGPPSDRDHRTGTMLRPSRSTGTARPGFSDSELVGSGPPVDRPGRPSRTGGPSRSRLAAHSIRNLRTTFLSSRFRSYGSLRSHYGKLAAASRATTESWPRLVTSHGAKTFLQVTVKSDGLGAAAPGPGN